MTYNVYSECTLGPQASRRFPLWSVHPPDDNPARMPSSSSCPTEINDLESSRTCWTLCSTSVEPPGRLSSLASILIMAQCCEFSTRIESEYRAEYCRNWDRWGVTWYDVPDSRSHVLDSSVVSRTFDSIGFSMDSMFGSLVRIFAEEPMSLTSSCRLLFWFARWALSFLTWSAQQSALMCPGFLQ